MEGGGAEPLGDALHETTVWASFPGDGNTTMIVRARELSVRDAEAGAAPSQAAAPPPSAIVERGSCSQDKAQVFEKTDIVGADYKGIAYRTLDVSNASDALGACSRRCCAWEGCAAWVVQSGTAPSTHDHNCTARTSSCCWLKPNGGGARVANARSTVRRACGPRRPCVVVRVARLFCLFGPCVCCACTLPQLRWVVHGVG